MTAERSPIDQMPSGRDRERIPVSVVIPAYNRADMVRRAVGSVWAQRRFEPAQLIVVDDCSTDDTGEVARGLGAEVVRTPQNLGEGGARNAGIAAARQPWVALLDSDDEWLPHLLETLWPLRRDHLLVTGSCLWRAGDAGGDRFAGVPGRQPQVLNSPAVLIYPGNFITASGVMARRDAIVEGGGYDASLERGADLDLWIRLLERGTGVASPIPVSIYHVHSGQVTADKSSTRAAHLDVARAYQDRQWMTDRLSARARGVVAWDALREALAHGRPREAWSRAIEIAVNPFGVGIAGILWRRWRLRRRGSQFGAQGAPTTGRISAGLPAVRDLVKLAVHPSGVVVVNSPAQARLVRALGIDPIGSADERK
jgi:glycosyltransferase involved in cell wall biosynthesis